VSNKDFYGVSLKDAFLFRALRQYKYFYGIIVNGAFLFRPECQYKDFYGVILNDAFFVSCIVPVYVKISMPKDPAQKSVDKKFNLPQKVTSCSVSAPYRFDISKTE
jgi:hypothetical protein